LDDWRAVKPQGYDPVISLIVPTRARLGKLRIFLDSLAETTANPSRIQLLLVVDDDDSETLAFRHPAIPFEIVAVSPGERMGALNRAGYAASRGDLVMLLNDDVIVRAPGWDERVVEVVAAFPDSIALVHVNDLIFGKRLCTFPLVTRTFCEMAGGICPDTYTRYRIDDHIFNVFRLLSCLGEKRIVYLPDLIFEHTNVRFAAGRRRYVPIREIHDLDTRSYRRLHKDRKQLASRLCRYIERYRSDQLSKAQDQDGDDSLLGDSSNLASKKVPGPSAHLPQAVGRTHKRNLARQLFKLWCVELFRRYR